MLSTLLRCLLLLLPAFLPGMVRGQQLKLGNRPAEIGKASVLELESFNQGLRLTRVDTAAVNLVLDQLGPALRDSANGMIVFQPADSSIYLLAGGAWRRLVQAAELGIRTLNGDSSTAQTLLTGSTAGGYMEPHWVDSTQGRHFLFLPDASEDYRGFVSTGYQRWSGTKVFGSAPGVTALSPGSVLYIADGGDHLLAEDNTHFYWDQTHQRLGIGNNAPRATLEITGPAGESGLLLSNVTSATAPETGAPIGVDVDGQVVRIAPTGIQSLDGVSVPDQTFIAASDGDDFRIDKDAVAGTHTFHLPDASGSARGLVNTGAQSFAGNKSFAGNVAVSGTTQIGTSGTPLVSVLRDTVHMNVGSVPGSGYLDVDFAVPGATPGATVMVSPAQDLPANCSIGYARVSSNGHVTVRFMNNNETTYTFDEDVLNLALLGLLNVQVLTGFTNIPAAAIDPLEMDYYFTIIR